MQEVYWRGSHLPSKSEPSFSGRYSNRALELAKQFYHVRGVRVRVIAPMSLECYLRRMLPSTATRVSPEEL